MSQCHRINFGDCHFIDARFRRKVQSLDHLNVRGPRAVVVSVPDHRASVDVIRQARLMAPKVKIFTRAKLGRHVGELEIAGASDTLNKELHAGLELGRRVEESLM